MKFLDLSHAKSSDLNIRRFQPPSPRVPALYRGSLFAALATFSAIPNSPHPAVYWSVKL
ncbi:hypothetical protein BVRB_015900 [Beta vulgaris subsp. vulgaris]|uniref:Uncharacterized protein n=1 Tax=Beta vulgaris subsp. vulgaris TaxID=3555 RepID=A0A0J8B4E0_BETVV|nr:hypothetical protein BVRB_015900 [Beta vulgaris subsp. vulgaris]